MAINLKKARKVEPTDIVVMVEKLGEVRAKMAPLKKDDEMLSAEIKEFMVPGGVITSDHYVATLTESTRREIDIPAVIKKIGQKKFLELATISMSALQSVLGASEIDEVVKDYSTVKMLSVKPRK